MTDLPVAGDVLFSVCAAEYLSYCTVKGLRADTVTRYEGILRGDLLPALGSLRLSEIGREEIVRLRDSLNAHLSPASINQTRIVLSGVLAHARRSRGYDGPDFSTWFDRARSAPQTTLDVLSPAEVELVADVLARGAYRRVESSALPAERSRMDSQYAALVRTAAYAGLRLSELRELRWKDIDWAGSKIVVRGRYTDLDGINGTKSGKIRTVPMAGRVRDALESLRGRDFCRGPSDLVFCNACSGHLSGDTIYQVWVAASSAAGIRRTRFHDLRHAAGSLWIQRFDLRQVQEWLGHASIQTTSRYLHARSRGDEAQAMDKLLEGAA